MMRFVAMLACTLCALPVLAADGKDALPSWWPQPDGYTVEDPRYVAYDYYRALSLPHGKLPRDEGGYTPLTGKVWKFHIGLLAKPKDEKAECLRTFASILPRLEALGFHKVGDPCCGATVLQKGPEESGTFVQNGACSVSIVEIAPNPFKLALKSPGDKPERFGVKDDIPYVAPMEGSRRTDGRNDVKNNLGIHPACNQKVPAEAFGTQYSEREYAAPAGVTAYAVQETYKAAFHAAGWDDVCQLVGVGGIDAHYTRNGRDVWSQVRTNGFGHDHRTYQIRVSDAGSGLRADLAKGCKAALYGVNFDFDKATLRADSEPALNQVLALMKDEPTLALEIGGHTDNVGKPDYNMKLSDARAASVVRWLVAHGIAKDRLTSHGYGDTQPLVKNDNDENRAKNRRVELKRKGCKG
jgi:outer membrane protein OmpA-like peptidoglycan-associated protein